MCGRVVAATPQQVVAEIFEATVVGEEVAPSWNVAPSATLYAVAGTRTGRRLGTMRWGLVPSWATSPAEGPRPINARADTLLAKPLFADAVARRRCILPVDGFYEWERLPDGGRRPWYICSRDGSPLALAGLWDRWVDRAADTPALVTCTIVTTEANPVVEPLHDRMPVVLEPDDWDTWLDPAAGPSVLADVLPLLRPAPAETLHRRPANTAVNRTTNDGPELLSA